MRSTHRDVYPDKCTHTVYIMKQLSIIDSHCDTAFELYHRGQELFKNSCHVSLEGAQTYENYAQFFAIWADKRKSDDECFEDFLKISDNLLSEIEANSDSVSFVSDLDGMTRAWASGKRAAFLAVEDARILGGDITRLDELARRKVKYLTLLWGGHTSIGASHDVEGGLTPFGVEVVRRCFELGIAPDVSHANEQVTDMVCEMAFEHKKPFIASHSNCYEQFPHTRNLRRRHLDAITELGGIVGLNLCPYHIKDMSGGEVCTLDALLLHVEKYMELGAQDVLGLGCDLDGTDLPYGIEGIKDVYLIADGLARIGYSNGLIDKLFYKNYYDFIKRNF